MAATGRGPIDPRLVRRARATRTFLIAGVAAGSATAMLVTYQAWLLSRSVVGVVEGTIGSLTPYVGLLAVVLLGRAGLSWLTTWLAHKTAAAVKSQLRSDILSARLRTPGASATPASTVVTLLTQGLDALDGYFAKYLPQLVLAVTVPVITGAAILFADLQAALIIAVTIPLIPLFMALVGWRTADVVRRRWRQQTRLARHFADLVAGLPTLQVFGRARAQLAGLRATEDGHRRETLRTLRVSFLSAFVLELLSTLAVAVVAVTIGTRLVYYGIDFRTALFVLILAPEVYLPIRQVGVHYHDSADGLAAAEAAFTEIDKAERFAGVATPSGDDLVVDEVSKTWPGATVPGLPPTSLTLRRGEVVALAGPTGAGKSTLVSAILGFLVPTSGEIRVGGEPLSTLDIARWRQQVAYVGQTPGIVAGTVADNVRLADPEAGDAEVREVLDQAGAARVELDHPVGDDGEGLSAGERRRVGIARALLRIRRGAWLLVLDEPTAGLDASAETQVLASVRESGAAALVVSHRQAVLAAADRVVTMSRAAEQASPPEPALPPESGEEAAAGTVSASPAPEPQSDPMPPPATDAELIGRLLDRIPRGRWRLVGAVLLAAAASGASVALMGVSAWLISKAAEHPNFLDLSVAAVGVRFFGISRACFRYVERLAGHDLALRMQSVLRLATYDRLSATTLLGRRRGDLLVRVVADVEAVQDVVVRVIQPFAAAVLVMIVSTVLLGRFSVPAALAIFASALVGGLLVPWLAQRASRAADADAVRERGHLATVVHDVVRSAADRLAYGVDAAAVSEAAAVDDRLRRDEERAAVVRGAASAFQVLAAGAAVLAGLWLGADAVRHGQMSPPLLAVLVLTPLALHEVLGALSQSAQTATRAQAALARVRGVLSAPPVGRGDVIAGADERPSATITDLTIGWPGEKPVAAHIALTVEPGEAVAVVAPSGGGKTTLAATILGLIPPVAGSVTTTGRVGYLAQDAHIFATTLSENVRIGNRDASEADVVRAMREAGLPLDPAREVGELGATLSGGEMRRVALARLFVGDYRLLVLDEPTEHLDRETATALMDDIFAGLAERPVLVMTHDAEVIARCTRVVQVRRRGGGHTGAFDAL